MTTITRLAGAFVWTLSAFTILVPRIFPQSARPSPIRVNSNLVVVRAAVLDRNHMFDLSDEERECMRSDQQHFYGLSLTRPYIPKTCWGLVVRDLKAEDFHLFVEGAEQKIQGFNLERSNILVRDNFGAHNEFSFTPTGKWTSVDLPLPTSENVPLDEAENFHYFYNLAFVPEGAASVSCHKIKLKVDRPHTVVYYRREYCAQQTPFDVLAGSDLGKQLEQHIGSAERGKLPLLYQIGNFRAANGKSRVWLSIDFEGESLARHWEWDDYWGLHASVSILGIVRSRDGTEVLRFTDLGCCFDYSTARLFTLNAHLSPAVSKQMKQIERVRVPIRYETQFDLPPGDYELHAILGDGARAGHIQAELRIENPEGQVLALSSVMLGKRVEDARVAAEEMAAAQNFAPQYVPMVSKGVQVAPTGSTRFNQDEQMLAYFEVYEPRLGPSPLIVQAHLRVSSAATHEVKTDLGSIDAAAYIAPGSTTIPIVVRIPFQNLLKGSYNLEVQATDSSGQITPWHSASFTLE